MPAVYQVGTVKNGNNSTNIIIQDCSLSIEFDTSEVRDENGNVKYVQHYNHRATGSLNGVVPRDEALWLPGSTISFKGFVLPTAAADGSLSGSLEILDDAASGTAIDFLVSSVNISTSNTDVAKVSLTITRYLENELGGLHSINS